MDARHALDIGGVRWRVASGVDPVDARHRVEAAVAALDAGTTVPWKERRHKTLHAVDLKGDGRADHLLKEQRSPRGLRWLRDSQAVHELQVSETAARRGVPTPTVIAAGNRQESGVVTASYLLVELRTEATDLRQLWLGPARTGIAPRSRTALVEGFGRFVRAVHEAGLDQDDFAPNNFLVECEPTPRFWMIDFERTRVRRRLARRDRVRMLAKLERELAQSSRADRLRFLRAYAESGEGEVGARDRDVRRLWQSVAGAVPRLARRDARRLARTETRHDSPTPPRQVAGWHGWADTTLSTADLEALVHGSPPPPRVWCTPVEVTDPRDARRLWARAHLLSRHRRLAPPPRALLYRNTRAWLISEREPEAIRLVDADDSRARPALRVLLARLLALGRLPTPPAPTSVVLVPRPAGEWSAQLLAPGSFRPGGQPPHHPRRRAFELAASTLPPPG